MERHAPQGARCRAARPPFGGSGSRRRITRPGKAETRAMNAIPTPTLGDLIRRYDVFFIDQFGVLRDDTGPYDGAIFALQAVKDAGKTIVILSNSGRSGDYNAKRLVSIGF